MCKFNLEAIPRVKSWPSENRSFADPDKYRAEYNIVFSAIKHFRSYLPPIRQPESEPQLPCTTNGLVWERLYPHFMTLNAEIQLYYVLGDTDPIAYERCLDSAHLVKDLIDQLTDPEIAQIGVMFGVSGWMAIAGAGIDYRFVALLFFYCPCFATGVEG
jgi:hypothetical protein